MKLTLKYIYPALFGLLIYTTVRVINDTIAEDIFWERPWTLNLLEIACSIAMGYIATFLLRRLFRYFDARQARTGERSIGVEIGMIVLLSVFVNNITLTPMAALTDDGLSWGDFAIINIIPLLYYLIFYTVARSQQLLQAFIDSKLQMERISRQHLETELKFLKAQYHPHFLFNALNTIYFQVDEDPAVAKKTIEKFAELLRYQLYDQQQMVPLEKEINYLRAYIELQQLRTSDRLKLEVTFPPGVNGLMVYPLLLMPLVENAFKYLGGDYTIRFELEQMHDGRLSFTAVNGLHEKAKQINGSGIGLDNLKRRLELLYPGKHQLETIKEPHQFIARLSLITTT